MKILPQLVCNAEWPAEINKKELRENIMALCMQRRQFVAVISTICDTVFFIVLLLTEIFTRIQYFIQINFQWACDIRLFAVFLFAKLGFSSQHQHQH